MAQQLTRTIFEREGWLLVPRLLDPAKVDALLAATGELEREAAAFGRDTRVRGVFFQMQSASGRKDEPAIFVVLSWTIMAEADWQTAIQGAVDATKTHYPNLRRIDLMTIIRGPNNMACGGPNTYAESTHIPAALDAALGQVAAASPALVHVAPQFAVDACSDFDGVGPHLTAAGNTKLAAKIAAAFAN